jgi:hypothetical protein
VSGESDGFIGPRFEDGLGLRAVNFHSNVNAISGGDLSGLVEVRKRKARLIDVSEKVLPVEALGDIAKGGAESAIA